jgi:hypothetical protein
MFSKKKSFVLKGSMLCVAAVLLTACGGEAPKEDTTAAPVADTSAAASNDTEQQSYSLPSPLQIASIFKKSGLKYKDGVTSPMKDPAKYTASLNQALNLGVYSADLSYTVLNKQNQESMAYMKLSRQLADKLGMSAVFDEGNLATRFEKNLGNEDSLAYIIAELQMLTDMYLDENNQQQITSIVFAGAWIESMYIGSKVFDGGKKSGLNNKLAEQLNILGSILKSLNAQLKKDPAIAGLTADLQTIKNIYDELPSVKNNPGAADDSEKELSLTNEEVVTLSKKIEEVRTKFIKG